MSEEQIQFRNLQQKLADLQKRQELFNYEILHIKEELEKLGRKPEEGVEDKNVSSHDKSKEEPGVNMTTTDEKTFTVKPLEKAKVSTSSIPKSEKSEEKIKTDLERFIGENLINKIGIVVTVIGVGIGAKYAIDHQLISPLTRIIMGYLVGLGLLFFALWLKRQYENFSAVLLSGSMSIMYFITYAAYSFYGLYPQIITFILMVIFTALTVLGALRYNREIIAAIGMVGAFAVPFLLNEGPENVLVFFSYITIINSGILFIAFKKYWKPLYFSAFVFTWLIYFTWFSGSYKPEENFTLDLMKNTHSYKFGLSILAGVYALMLIVIGISGKKRYLRIAAMTLLGITLAKLFFYDISRLDTILKTILFMALGILMLLVSFLYNKYNMRLFGEIEVEKDA